MTIGAQATYAVTVRNTGSSAASNVQTVITITPADAILIGTLPAGCSASGNVITCTASAVAAGGSVAYDIPVTIQPNVSEAPTSGWRPCPGMPPATWGPHSR